MNAEMMEVTRETQEVDLYVKIGGPGGGREEASTGGSETMLTFCRWLCKQLLDLV